MIENNIIKIFLIVLVIYAIYTSKRINYINNKIYCKVIYGRVLKVNVYLIRHGEVNHNLNKTYNRENEDLNDTGINQALELRDKMENIPYDLIISSPLKRALHTANIINIKNKEIIIDNRLIERDPGNLSGKSLTITNRNEYWNYYSKMQYGTSESIISTYNRVKDFLDEMKTKDYKNILIVAHSGISKLFYAYFNGIPKDGNLLKLGLKNCEIKKYIL